MNAEQIRWWMEVFRKNLYTQLGIAIVGALLMGGTVMFHTVIGDIGESKGEIFLLGLALFLLGLVSCQLSGIAYDRAHAKLPAAESIERKEKDKEKKHAAKSKTH